MTGFGMIRARQMISLATFDTYCLRTTLPGVVGRFLAYLIPVTVPWLDYPCPAQRDPLIFKLQIINLSSANQNRYYAHSQTIPPIVSPKKESIMSLYQWDPHSIRWLSTDRDRIAYMSTLTLQIELRADILAELSSTRTTKLYKQENEIAQSF